MYAHGAPPTRSTGKHSSGTQVLFASLPFSNRFQTPAMRTRPNREPETPNPQPGHPTTHHEWESPIMQHGNTRTSAQTAFSTEPSLTTSILATNSLPIQESRFPPTGNGHWLHTLTGKPVTHLTLLVQPFRRSPPLCLSPISLTKVPVTCTARVPGSGWGEWGKTPLSH